MICNITDNKKRELFFKYYTHRHNALCKTVSLTQWPLFLQYCPVVVSHLSSQRSALLTDTQMYPFPHGHTFGRNVSET